ncbi:MAG: hypothetical protein R6W82_06555 [bacterium]
MTDPLSARIFILPALLTGMLTACGQPGQSVLEMEEEAVQEVVSLLQGQAEAWSAGDIDGFVSIYAEGCTFPSPDGVSWHIVQDASFSGAGG